MRYNLAVGARTRGQPPYNSPGIAGASNLRDRAKVAEDVAEGWVTPDAARAAYGWEG